MTSGDPLDRFKPLSEKTSLLTPAGVDSSELLIICCAWMNAAPEHIAKYTNAYSKQFPQAIILLIRNSLFDTFRRQNISRESLAEAVSVIRSHTKPTSNSKPPRILFHIFSNGGANQAVELSSAFKAFEGRPIPAQTLILDSCPGKGQYSSSYRAITSTFPDNMFFNTFGRFIVHLALSSRALFQTVTGVETKFAANGRALNNPSLFDPQSERVYAYSKADVIVRYTDVEESAQDAEQKGWSVEKVRFEKSAHAAHLLEDSDRYWKSILRPLKTSRL